MQVKTYNEYFCPICGIAHDSGDLPDDFDERGDVICKRCKHAFYISTDYAIVFYRYNNNDS